MSRSRAPAGVSDPRIDEVWGRYHAHHSRAKLGEKARRLIRDRLGEGWGVEELGRAIDGYEQNPWHRGENDRGKRYTSLALYLRDSEHVLAGLEMAERPERPPPGQAEANRERIAKAAWRELWRAVTGGGFTAARERWSPDTPVGAAVGRAGGWTALGRLDPKKDPWDFRGRFMEAYRPPEG